MCVVFAIAPTSLVRPAIGFAGSAGSAASRLVFCMRYGSVSERGRKMPKVRKGGSV